ncbi:MAG TPA: D-amino acid dehydrogenase [Alphaproteobacteria bacterium]|nr:D-amino acid dehydrogenase [Alphaproteobacteria bacterium]
MKALVLGGGVIGVASAYYLAENGYRVTVIERRDKAASEASYGNAGLITPGDSYAWASPEALKLFIKSLYRRDLGIKVRAHADPRLWLWSAKFLKECTRARARINTLRKLRLALYSRDCLDALVARTGIRFDRTSRGVLYFFRSQESLDHGVGHMRLLADHGLRIEVLDRDALVRIEPALEPAKDKLSGAIFSPMDQTGDCSQFGRNLAEWCERNAGVAFRYGTSVTALEVEGNSVRRAMTNEGPIEADTFVLATGAESPRLAQGIGVKLPIYPVKGYSLTVPIRERNRAPSIGGVDEDKLIAFSRLGDRLRLAATAEFAGYDTHHRPRDFAALIATARELFPEGGDYAAAESWAGLRPMTPSSVPILGRAVYRNLFLNVGHGHVGWTLCCGSGKFVADLVKERQPEIDPEGLLYSP